MKRRNLNLVNLCLVLGVIFVWTFPAFAAPPQLKGQYAFTGESGFISTPVGFDPIKLTALASGVDEGTMMAQGVRTFNGDGTGTVQATAIRTITPVPSHWLNVPPYATSETIFYEFTYTVTDGQITTQLVPGTYVGTFTGPETGLTYSIDNFSFSGTVSKDGKTIILSTDQPEIETHTFNYAIFNNGNGGTTNVLYVICHRSRVLTWLGN
ncbi:MAG: hypothetical protein ACLQVJ_02840 [Syntrophobacteraceae bacterium]